MGLNDLIEYLYWTFYPFSVVDIILLLGLGWALSVLGVMVLLAQVPNGK